MAPYLRFSCQGGDPYDRDVVLRALVQSVADYRRRGRTPDVIFATGDIAHSGKANEYQLAEKFFDDLLKATGLEKHRLFVIPGNHDVDRDLGVGLARTLDSREQADTYFRPDLPKPHLTWKLRAFLDWHNRYFDGIRVAPDHSTCGPVELLEVNSRRLGILPINSALFCQGDDDHDKLWIGRRCLDAALTDLRKIGSELNIALIHHPLDWLSSSEGSNIQGSLETSVQILLRGHLHETRIESVASAEGQVLRCAAGAAYQSRKWPNRALYETLEGNQLSVFPIRYEDAPRELWTTDSSVFPREEKHEKSFAIPGTAQEEVKPPPPPPARLNTVPLRFRSNIAARGNRPFVGRDNLIAQIAGKLGDPVSERVLILHGQPGVGKSELAREFARLHRDRYSGGTFWIDASTDALDINFANIGKNILDLEFRQDLPLSDQGQRTFYTLGATPVLLIYDNVRSFERLEPWLPLSGMPCHVLITTLVDSTNPAWPCLEVEPLSHEESLELVEKLTGSEVAKHHGEAIAKYAGGLPVQIVPAATTLAYEQRRGRRTSRLGLARETGDSFRAAYDRLEQPARLLLHAAAFLNPQRIPRDELSRHLGDGLGWSEADVGRALDTCLDLHLLDGAPDPSMHQLFASFLRDLSLSAEDQAALVQIRPVQARRFAELANTLSGNPVDSQTATTLMSYPLAPAVWDVLGKPLSIEECRTVGQALYEIGHFEEAQPWFERAVAEAEKRDVHGRIDHGSLGNSLHLVGYCLSNLGRYAEAQPWFERAVAEAEKGDVHGRIDHGSLGNSLSQVGYCLSSLGRYAEAQPWFERAVAETEKGDVHGRINHGNLGTILRSGAACLRELGYNEQAQQWEQRASNIIN